MALIGEMLYLTIGDKTYSLPSSGGSGTVTSVNLSNASNGGLTITGGPITSAGSITVGHSNVLTSAQTTQAVYPIKIDKNGHISAYGTAVTIPVVPTNVSAFTNDAGYLTSYTETDPVFTASAAYGISSSDITNWNNKTSNTGTVTSVGLTNATNGGLTISGSPITSSGSITVGHSNILSSAQTTSGIYPIKIDKNGHISEYGTAVTSMPASDVSAWAKAASKPSYNFSEIGSTPTSISGYGITDAYTKSEVDGLVSGVLHYKGTKATVSALPSSGNTTGDVWHVTADGSEWAWDGTTWQELGTAVDLSGYVPTSRTINSKALTGNISLTASDVGALPSSTTIPSKTSDLTNDSGFITSYTDEKLKTTTASNNGTYYFVLGNASTTAETKYYTSNLRYSKSDSMDAVQIGQVSSSSTRKGRLTLTSGAYYIYLDPPAYSDISANKTYTLPTSGGTIALTSDIPDVSGKIDTAGTGLSKSGTTLNHTNSVIAQTTQGVYPITIDAQGHISAYGSAVSIPTKVSDLTNDSGYITGYTETDPTVPSWAKASSKPSYTASEVGAATSDHVHGNITNGGDITAAAPTIASGDQIVINDNSASKITNGPTFDGSTTTTALTPKGTWETFAKSDTNTTYALSNALSSHKFTETLTAGGSGSGTSTATLEFAAGTGITLTDDTTNKKITIASSVVNTDSKVSSSNSASKLFLVGTTSQSSSGQDGYSNSAVYETNGALCASSFNGGYPVYPVKGTQTAATNVWTGAINAPALYDGMTIAYFLPWAGTSTAATLNLTLSGGGTTGAKNVYYSGTSRATTHYAKGSTIILTYWSAGSISVDGVATTDDRWLTFDYNANSNVTQTATTTDKSYRMLVSYTDNDTAETKGVYKTSRVYVNPSTADIGLYTSGSEDLDTAIAALNWNTGSDSVLW